MTPDRCDRMWQVEALHDGRLEAKDRASFDRHAQICEVCSAQLVRQRELLQIMSEAPRAERSDLERRRARIALLGEANRRVVGRQTPSRKVRFGALAAAVLLLALGTFALTRRSLPRNLPGFEVVDVAQSDWSAEKEGTTSRVTLRSGVASFHVEHVSTGTRFLVLLPDGEIEVRGTRFVVDVTAGHTRSVLVTEGVVALRLGGGAELVLHPGERWQSSGNEASRLASARREQESEAQLAPPTVAATSINPRSTMAEGNSVAPTKGAAAQSNVMGVVSLAPTQPSAKERTSMPATRNEDTSPSAAKKSVESAGMRFAEGVEAFSAGDYGRADSLFGAFARDFPSDSRAEDATFLRADARARRGDKVGAAAAARAYIQAYPNGLRRPEAELLAEY